MFWPSDTSVGYLCNALVTLHSPVQLLQNYGLLPHGAYVEYDDDAPYSVKPSWQELKKDIERALSVNSPQLRSLCEELLRRRTDGNWRTANLVADSVQFQDWLAKLEEQLSADGYKFNGFDLCEKTVIPSIAQLADEAISAARSAGDFPEVAKSNLSVAERFLGEDKHDDCLAKLRLVFQSTLTGIAEKLATRRGDKLPAFKQDKEVRDHLKSIGFLLRKKRMASTEYGLLSAGPHGKGNREMALLGYAACTMACRYALTRLQHFGTGKPDSVHPQASAT